jgi:uncharacterized protein (TIGR00255 family)
MLISMTGFGQSQVSNRDYRVTVEIRTVNHRFLDFSIKIPKAINSREKDIKEIIKKKISRGRVSVNVSVESERPEYQVRINRPLMERYMRVLEDFGKKHGLSGRLDINTLAMLPDVFVQEENGGISDKQWQLVKQASEKALAECVGMRLAEGRVIETDLRKRMKIINRLVEKIERQAPKALAASRGAFRERLQQLVQGAKVDRDRWMTEMSILADRLDFTEELTRLKSHIGQFAQCLDEDGAVSKKLTYILQEIHREITTVGSKASNAGIIENVVLLKEESEKLREQVQNIE